MKRAKSLQRSHLRSEYFILTTDTTLHFDTAVQRHQAATQARLDVLLPSISGRSFQRRTYAFDATIADQTGELIRQYRAQGITSSKPDAMIVATGIYHDAVLLTYNSKHFPMSAPRLYEAMPTL